MAQKVLKTGNSLAVTIPADWVKMIGIKAGDEVKLEVESSQGKISYFFSGNQQLPLLGNFTRARKKRK